MTEQADTTDWKQRRHPAGSRVEVHDVDSTHMGPGSLLTDYDCDAEDNPMPVIRLDSGKYITGCECWWIPVVETTPLAGRPLHEHRPPTGVTLDYDEVMRDLHQLVGAWVEKHHLSAWKELYYLTRYAAGRADVQVGLDQCKAWPAAHPEDS